jgi:hypothetical protein
VLVDQACGNSTGLDPDLRQLAFASGLGWLEVGKGKTKTAERSAAQGGIALRERVLHGGRTRGAILSPAKDDQVCDRCPSAAQNVLSFKSDRGYVDGWGAGIRTPTT